MLKTEAPSVCSVRKSLPWAEIAWFGALLVVCYWPVLKFLVWQWGHDEDFGHGFFVPFVAGYIIWQRRDALAAPQSGGHGWGLLIVMLGAIQLWLGTLGSELFLSRTAFLVSLVGAVMYLGGISLVRRLAFPLFLLLFMIPIPAIVYNQVAFPLQLLASRIAEIALGVLGVPVMREGNVLELASQTLNVVDACSGIRSLLSLGFLSLVYAFFFDPKPWMRGVLLVATVPIALAANAARVTVTGVLSEFNTELAKGFMHSFEGWLIFMVALAMLALFHQTFNRVYRRVHDRK